MKKQFLVVCCLGLLATGCRQEATMQEIVAKGLARGAEQAEEMARVLATRTDRLPKTTGPGGELVTSDAHWWCSGFFPGTLWYLYEATGQETLKRYAIEYTRRVEAQQYTTDNHDIGFILNCSFGNAYRLTRDETYAAVLSQGAASLATRFNPSVGAIRSWDHRSDRWQYPVIIDNMMNLELLERAARLPGGSRYAAIASSHARVTMRHHFRPDYSCYHVVSYDPATGLPEKKNTHQGFSDESAWARGQAWALYGYTMMFRETGDTAFLEQAERIAAFLLDHPRLPADKIPYWDFDAPDIPNAPRDASAAAIMASAFIELSGFCRPGLASRCLQTAETQLRTLTSDTYLAAPGTNGGFILKHSVGNLPGGKEVDVPLTYADYYYTEALVRYNMRVPGRMAR